MYFSTYLILSEMQPPFLPGSDRANRRNVDRMRPVRRAAFSPRKIVERLVAPRPDAPQKVAADAH